MNADRQTSEYKRLAFSYFGGTISQADGERLFQYVNGAAGRSALLAQWEQEWMATHDETPEVQAGWDSLEKLIPFDHEEKNDRGRFSWRTLWSVAASVIAVACIAATAWLMRQESYVVCRTPNGGRTDVVLPDGSRVTLNANSEVRYATHFLLTDRHVWLRGEAFFDVTKRSGKTFVVTTPAFDIVVRGTQFNISAYDDEATSTVRLYRGKVELQFPDTTLVMRPGDQISYDKARRRLSSGQFPTDNLGWVEGCLEADDMPLGTLIRMLSRQYGVRIHVADRSLLGIGITMHLHQESNIDDVMSALQRVMDIKVVRRARDIYITPARAGSSR